MPQALGPPAAPQARGQQAVPQALGPQAVPQALGAARSGARLPGKVPPLERSVV